MLFGGEKNMIHDDEGGPEWPEEEVRLDKWRSERGQKVIWTDLLYNEQYSSEGGQESDE